MGALIGGIGMIGFVVTLVILLIFKVRKKPVKQLAIVLAIFFGCFVIGMATTDTSSDTASSSPSGTQAEEPKEKPAEVAKIPYEAQLGSGNYTAGIDFPAGTYDLEAIEGGGNVSSDNIYSGGLNAVMGTAEMNNSVGVEMYEQTYSNVKLEDGVTLTISGPIIKIKSDAASGAPLTPRNQEITEKVPLGSGNFVAGTDFPAGIYDIIAVSGGGNVSSDNMYNGGLNAVMGTADMNQSIGGSMYEQEYKNINLEEGVSLSVSGVKIELVPSK